MASDVFREIEDRLNSNRNAACDVFAISMHNMDRFYTHAGILGGGEHPVEYKGLYPGGAGANTAVALSRLGMRTAVAGAVSSDGDGKALQKALIDSNVNNDFVLQIAARDGRPTGHANIYTRRPYPNTVMTYSGANEQFKFELRRRRMHDELLRALNSSRVVHFSPVGRPSELELHESIIRRIHSDNVVTIKPGSLFGSHAPGRLHALIGRANVLFFREQELDLLLVDSPTFARHPSHSRTPWEKLNAIFEWRHSRGHDQPLIIVLKTAWHHDRELSDPGYIYVGWGVSEFQDGIKADDNLTAAHDSIVDTTGDADGIAAGVLFGLLRSRPPLDCANLAYVLSMSVSTRFGCRTGLPSRANIHEHWRRWFTDEAPDWLRSGAERIESDASDAETGETTAKVDMSEFTERELDVISLLNRGCSNREIAKELVIAEGTASVHVSRILRKLGVKSRQQAVARLLQHTRDTYE